MYWQDDSRTDDEYVVPNDVVDVVYRMRCSALPIDHVHALSSALHDALPWLQHETYAGVHPIHGAESGNGWQRPDQPDATLHLSRRTRLRLRLPAHRVNDARALVGRELAIAGHQLQVGELAVKPLRVSDTLFARHMASRHADDEQRFLSEVAAQLRALDVSIKRVLAGRRHSLRAPNGPVETRSLMVASLSPAESIRLQQQGLGSGRTFCCGLFVPHRGIDPVGSPGGGG